MDKNAAAASAKAQAHADLAAAEADAAALLADLNGTGGNPKYKMPSRYGPGDGPRDPRSSVAGPGGGIPGELFGDEGNFSGNWKESTLPKSDIPTTSGHIDFKQKIDDARKPYGSH